MSNIPGIWGQLPSGDPIIDMVIGTPEGRLLTDQWGSKFIIEGDAKLTALAVLKHVTSKNVYGSNYSAYDPALNKITEMHFSRFEFNFKNGIQITVLRGKESEEATILLKEMLKIVELKAFL